MDNLEAALKEFAKAHEPAVDFYLYVSKDCIMLSQIQVRKDAPSGTGTAAMEGLCELADRFGVIICVEPGKLRGERGDPYKNTSSVGRLKQFYRRFGFVSNSAKGRYDLRGTMHRQPAQSLARRLVQGV